MADIYKFDTIQELIDLWREDSAWNKLDLLEEETKISKLHSKYQGIASIYGMKSRKLKWKYNKLRLDKYEWYNGKMSEEKLKELGWNPFSLKILKQDILIYLEGDEDLNIIEYQMGFYDEIAKYAISVVKELNNRTWQLKGAIDMTRYNGGY